jgi:hypothetical protein
MILSVRNCNIDASDKFICLTMYLIADITQSECFGGLSLWQSPSGA